MCILHRVSKNDKNDKNEISLNKVKYLYKTTI